jgi:hypothetical protein
VIRVRTARRLGDDTIYEPKTPDVFGRDLHRRGGLGRERGVVPEDRRAPLGRDDRVDRVLEHQDAIRDGDGERAATAALADDRGDDRHPQAGHLEQVRGDRERLAALLRRQRGVRARRVDEGDHRQAELLGLLHQAQRLAVPLRAGHPEAAVGVLLRVAPLLVADHHHRAAGEPGRAAHQGRVLGEEPVAVQLDELLEQRADVVEGVRALGVARELDPIPGRELRPGRAVGRREADVLDGAVCLVRAALDGQALL